MPKEETCRKGVYRLEPECRLQDDRWRLLFLRAKQQRPFVSMSVTWDELNEARKRKKFDHLYSIQKPHSRAWTKSAIYSRMF
jgi:hypothetical protein